MLALYSFGTAVHREWGREQFLAVYTTAAVAASLASHVATIGPLLSSSSMRVAMRMGRHASWVWVRVRVRFRARVLQALHWVTAHST